MNPVTLLLSFLMTTATGVALGGVLGAAVTEPLPTSLPSLMEWVKTGGAVAVLVWWVWTEQRGRKADRAAAADRQKESHERYKLLFERNEQHGKAIIEAMSANNVALVRVADRLERVEDAVNAKAA